MFDKLRVKIIGLVDNIIYFIGYDGKKYRIFGEGVKETAEELIKISQVKYQLIEMLQDLVINNIDCKKDADNKI